MHQAEFGCSLIGGDTDQNARPAVDLDHRVRRGADRAHGAADDAAVGDHVFVTGTLGDAALGLAIHTRASAFGPVLTEGDRAFLVGRYLRPNPRLALAPALRANASAALDVSDGFLKDLVRLAGSLGVTVDFAALPLSPPAAKALAHDARVASLIVAGGDDYEILCSVPDARLDDFEKDAAATGVGVTRLGVLTAGAATMILGPGGEPLLPRRAGYDHFA